MRAEKKVIDGIIPVTTTSAVYLDGTNKTLQEAIDNGELGGITRQELDEFTGGKKQRYVTQIEYDKLTPSEKENIDIVWNITDSNDDLVARVTKLEATVEELLTRVQTTKNS